MKLKGKTALVTGGGSGLGLAVARLLLEKGMKVAICGRTEKTLIKAAEELDSDDLSIFVCDVREHEQVEQMVGQIGQIDVLVNAAGIWVESRDLEDYTQTDIDEVIDINLKGTVIVTKQVLDQMKERNTGYIVNVASTSGLVGRAGETIYCASKFGVQGFTLALEAELRETNVDVIGFYPGGMKTKFFEKGGQSRENDNWMDPEAVAKTMVFMIENGETMDWEQVVMNRKHFK